LDADAALALREGDTARAEADLLAVLQVGELLYEEPLIAANWSARDAYRRVYRRLCANPPRSLSAEAEQALLRQWVHGTDRTAFAESFLGEAVAAANTFEDAHGSVQLDAYRNGSFRSYLEGGGQYIYTGVLKPWFDRDVAYYLGALRAVSGAVSLPYPEARIRIGAIALEAEQLPWTYRISRQSPEAWIGLLDDRAEHEALFGLAQLGLTIERHAHEMGSVPASLDEIAARLPAGPPTDPFTEQPYIYRTSDDGFILYSVGSNGIDNGGQHSHEDGDIVWRGRNDDVRQTPVTVVNSDGEEVGPFESDE
jgi:hypothetical protein